MQSTSIDMKRKHDEPDTDDEPNTDAEHAALSRPAFFTETDFSWFDIPTRLRDLASADWSSKNSTWVDCVVMTAVGLNNYAASKGLPCTYPP